MNEPTIPQFIVTDPASIMSECKQFLEEYLEREIHPAQIEQAFLQFIVYRETLLTNRFNYAMSQMLVPFSSGAVLDMLAMLVAVERLPAEVSRARVRFDLVEGHGQVTLPLGTRVSTADGINIYETIEDCLIPRETMTVEVPVQSQIPGSSGNGYEPGTIINILDPLPFVAKVENIDTTNGGSDVETDMQLRERIKLAPSQYSSAGSFDSYRFYAKGANSQITNVSVSSPIPGAVLIVPLTGKGILTEKILEDINKVCNAETVRPLTDTVIISSPIEIPYRIEVDVILYENTDPVEAKKNITEVLERYINDKRETLGQDIIRSHIAQLCRGTEVYDVVVISPSQNIIISEVEVPVCFEDGILVNITGFNRG